MSPVQFLLRIRGQSSHTIYQIENFSLQLGRSKTYLSKKYIPILGFNIFTTQESGKIEENC